MVEPLTAGMPPTFRARGRKVFVVNKRPENLSDRHGYQVDFALANEADMPEDIVIYQNVKVKIETINSEGETDDMNYEFSCAHRLACRPKRFHASKVRSLGRRRKNTP